MNKRTHLLAAVMGATAIFSTISAFAQQSSTVAQAPSADTARPRNPAANLPSDTGSQTTNPSGAVTGAGQPQGTGRQTDVGSAGGLEQRARAQERAARATGAAGGTSSASESRPVADRPQARSRERRASKG